MKAQLTVYVAPPLLDTGGTVIVVANSIPLEQWNKLAEGNNPARDDPNNEKKSTIQSGDKLFGAVASTKVSIIVFVYPENGTYGFNLVGLNQSDDPDKRNKPLQTKRILVGDGGYVDWSTGQEFTWEDVSTIHVLGPKSSEEDSRGASVSEAAIMNLHPPKTIYEGATLYAPTDEQLDKALVKIPH